MDIQIYKGHVELYNCNSAVAIQERNNIYIAHSTCPKHPYSNLLPLLYSNLAPTLTC